MKCWKDCYSGYSPTFKYLGYGETYRQYAGHAVQDFSALTFAGGAAPTDAVISYSGTWFAADFHRTDFAPNSLFCTAFPPRGECTSYFGGGLNETKNAFICSSKWPFNLTLYSNGFSSSADLELKMWTALTSYSNGMLSLLFL